MNNHNISFHNPNTQLSILMVSKPVVPPWNDSSKNLVKDLALAGTRFTYRVLTVKGYQLNSPHIVNEPIYRAAGQFSPAIEQNLRAFLRLLKKDTTNLTHFFFAPNEKTSLAARLADSWRSRLTVQTVCSAPKSFAHATRILFANKIVVLSQHTRQSFIQAGINPHRLMVIPPGIQIPPQPMPQEKQQIREEYNIPPGSPLVIYPGDYQFSSAADTFARAILQLEDLPATYIFACRIKQQASIAEEQRIRQMLLEAGMLSRVIMLREVKDMLRLLSICDLCVLPAESLYAKMDVPLVLLEAMALGVPLIIADHPPLSEILSDGGGLMVTPQNPSALAHSIREMLSHPELLKKFGEKAKHVVSNRYAIAHTAQQYEDLYQAMIEENMHG